MKKILGVLLIVMCMVPSAFTQQMGRVQFLANGGFNIPYQPAAFADRWKWGFNGGVGFGYLLQPNLIADLYVDYHQFGFDRYGFQSSTGRDDREYMVDGEESSIISVTANLKYLLDVGTHSLFPYFLGGAGFLSYETPSTFLQEIRPDGLGPPIVYDGTSQQGFMILFGTGLDFPSTPTRSIYLEMRYAIGIGMDDSVQFMPFKVGVRQILF